MLPINRIVHSMSPLSKSIPPNIVATISALHTPVNEILIPVTDMLAIELEIQSFVRLQLH